MSSEVMNSCDVSADSRSGKALRVGYAVLAWNEAGTIGETIRSIIQQDVFHSKPDWLEHIQIAIVVNGSTDGTADVARTAFKKHCEELGSPSHVSLEVHEIPVASRQAAWNCFIHEVSDPKADFLGLMDGDIILHTPDTFSDMIRTLSANEHASLAAAKAIKDSTLRRSKGIVARLGELGTRLEHAARQPCISGQLYLGRAAFLRKIRAPYGLCGDDAMYTVLAWTSFMTAPMDFSRVALTQKAAYVFETYATIRDLWRQHRRRCIGGMMRKVLAERFEAERSKYSDVSELMRERFEEDKEWLLKAVRLEAREKGWKAIGWKPTKLTQLRHQPLPKAILYAPFAAAFALWSLIVSYGAYKVLLNSSITTVWAKPGNPRLAGGATSASAE